jgi:hypothetical protein
MAFDTGPLLLRAGAYSADRLTTNWADSAYQALSRLHRATGVQFLVGVNQHAENPEITKMQISKAREALPWGSIVGFTVGNEPGAAAGGGGRRQYDEVACSRTALQPRCKLTAMPPLPPRPCRHVRAAAQERPGRRHHAQRCQLARVRRHAPPCAGVKGQHNGTGAVHVPG